MTASTSFRALSTTALVAVPHRADLLQARGILAAQLEELDLACSRFRSDSQLSLVNARAGEAVPIGPLLTGAIDAALAAARTTDGIVDPLLGTHLRAAGYDRTFALVEARDGWTVRPVARGSDSWREIELVGSTVRIPAGRELDLGATAKALAADRAARTISETLQSPALVSLGGDVAVAGDGEWPILVADKHDAPLDGEGPCIAIHAGGVATSSTAARRWRTDRGAAHHVIDPRTGRPAHTCWRTVTVAAATCLDANVAATAAVVLGTDAVEWLRTRGLASRLVANDDAIVHVGGWPDEAAAA